MAGSFPSGKTHRPSRRKIGRAQFRPVPAINVVATVATTLVTLTYSGPVIANGMPPITVAGVTNLEWTQTAANIVTVTLSATGATAAYTYAGGSANVVGTNGGQVAPTSGTF